MLRAALEKIFGPLHVLDVDVTFHFNRQLLKLVYRLTLAAFDNACDDVALWIVPGVRRPQTFVIGARDTVPLVKPVIGGPAPL